VAANPEICSENHVATDPEINSENCVVVDAEIDSDDGVVSSFTFFFWVFTIIKFKIDLICVFKIVHILYEFICYSCNYNYTFAFAYFYIFLIH